MKVWREITSTSPSKLHIGHHKILIYKFDDDDKIEDNTSRWDFLRTTIEAQDHHEPPQQQPPSLEEMRIALLLAQIGLMNYAINHGYVYKRWTSVVNMMILKEENNTKIHQLRVIHLYEADYNLLLGVKWRQLMHHTVNNHLLHPSQYGGTPGRDSITPVLITEMQYKITRATRKPFVTLDFDATSCYDRIIESVASLAARSFRQNKSLCFVHARHLQEARYLLKTQLGICDKHFQHCKLFPIFGTGQGSANSPVIWCLISSRLFEAHDVNRNGAVFSSPDGKYKININMIGFVDDTYSGGNSFKNSKATIDEIIQKSETDAQL